MLYSSIWYYICWKFAIFVIGLPRVLIQHQFDWKASPFFATAVLPLSRNDFSSICIVTWLLWRTFRQWTQRKENSLRCMNFLAIISRSNTKKNSLLIVLKIILFLAWSRHLYLHKVLSKVEKWKPHKEKGRVSTQKTYIMTLISIVV